MDGRPLHYDGSVQNIDVLNSESIGNAQFTLTDEMRMNIGGNPFVFDDRE